MLLPRYCKKGKQETQIWSSATSERRTANALCRMTTPYPSSPAKPCIKQRKHPCLYCCHLWHCRTQCKVVFSSPTLCVGSISQVWRKSGSVTEVCWDRISGIGMVRGRARWSPWSCRRGYGWLSQHHLGYRVVEVEKRRRIRGNFSGIEMWECCVE